MTIYVGTKSGLHALELDDGARDAGIFDGSGRDAALVPGNIGALARDDATDSLWSVVNELEVFRDRERVAIAPIAPIALTSLAARRGVVIAGTEGARLWRVDRGAFVAGFDALDRRRWGTPWGGPPETMTCAILDDGTWLVGVHVGGVWRSEDEGRTWREVVDLDRDDHQISAHPNGRDIVVACGGGPVAVSNDGARTFAFPEQGIPHGYGTGVAIGASSVVLACASGPFAKKSVLVRAELGEHTSAFTGVHEASGKLYALSARGSVFAGATDDGHVHVSTDSGRTWRDVGARDAHSVVVL